MQIAPSALLAISAQFDDGDGGALALAFAAADDEEEGAFFFPPFFRLPPPLFFFFLPPPAPPTLLPVLEARAQPCSMSVKTRNRVALRRFASPREARAGDNGDEAADDPFRRWRIQFMV